MDTASTFVLRALAKGLQWWTPAPSPSDIFLLKPLHQLEEYCVGIPCTCAVFTLNTRTCLMNRANLFFFRPIAGMFTIGSRRTSDLLTIAAAPVLYSRRIRAQIQRRVESAYPTGERAKPASASLRNATHQRNQRRREHQRKYQSQGKEEEKEGKNAEDVCFPPSKGHCPEHELLVCCWLRDGGQGSVNSGSSLSNVFCQISGSERKS